MSEVKNVLITKEGLVKITEELENLIKVERPRIAEKIKEAKEFGDLSENAEYKDAREEQAFLEGRIAELEEQIKNAEVITESSQRSRVMIGSKVVIRNLTKKDYPEAEYTIVGSVEVDPLNNLISNESPVGAAVLGKKKGETVTIKTANGPMEYEVVKIR